MKNQPTQGQNWTRRIQKAISVIIFIIIFWVFVFRWAMISLEGQTISYAQTLQIVIEALTTAGFGGFAPWENSIVNLIVVGMNISGVILMFLTLPVFVLPFVRQLLLEPPSRIEQKIGHVIICYYSERTEEFISGLEARNCEYIVVEPDYTTARDLHRKRKPVIQGDPESIDSLKNAHLDTAMAVVANGNDQINASVALTVREHRRNGIRVVTLNENEELREYQQLAGADQVLSPKQLLGRSLASRIPTAVTEQAEDEIEIGDDLELFEFQIREESSFAGKTISELRLRNRFGVDILGAWTEGNFTSPIDKNLRLASGTRLLVAGNPDQIDQLQDEIVSTMERFSDQTVVIAGLGDAGSAAADTFKTTNTKTTVLDIEEKAGVDVVGDSRDPSVLREAGVENAAHIIITLNNDTTAIFTTLIARELNPDINIIVRANEKESEKKLHRAGANYVQSLETVSGRMMSSAVFEDEEVLTFDRQINVVKLPVGDLAGTTITEADVQAKTGCIVLAAIRGDSTITKLDPESFQFRASDRVIIAGTDETVKRFENTFNI